ncbi:MAG: HD-GYP domain-containing protein [Azoarcus sp.]|jgi:HD-GYP domain-containing protein (c-di-GMP phosphodiesterase class II)|nr:HD-GYP domain-containing protein [Azoarcus sp.]
MIKLIPIAKLQVGMYIHDLNCAWIKHDFLRNSFLVDSEKTLQKIFALGIQEIYIDASQGMDVDDAPTLEEVNRAVDRQIDAIADRGNAPPRIVTLGEERQRARKLHVEANRIVSGMMRDIRLGKQIEIEQIEPMVEHIVDSIFRQQDALLPLAQLKNHDEYTFQHSVSVCALMTTFARAMDMTRDVIHEIAIGALLHDVGKATVPDKILNKPGKLTDEEFLQMKSHVVQSKIILENTLGISPIALTVAAQHHERYDGSGYPNQLKGKDISCYGQMSAIVDVYDAITSDRCYHKGIPPTEALRKILEWSKFHFNPDLAQVFIRALGIYPTGSLVRLESGRLAIVEEQHPDRIMLPKVRTIFHVRGHYLKPEIIDLRYSQDRIVGYESFEQWKIDPARWKN